MNSRKSKYVVMFLLAALAATIGAQQLLAKQRPWIGVYMQDVTSSIAEAFDLKVKKGVLINEVADNSPAEKAGLKEEDVILSFNGQEIEDSDILSELVGASKVGDIAKLLVNRAGKEMEIAVTVGEREDEVRWFGRMDDESGPRAFQFLENFKTTGIGVSMQSLSGDLGEYFGVPEGHGALITEVMKDTPAAKAGLKVGDVIVKVDGDKVESPGDVSEIIGDKEKGEKVDLVVVRDKAEKLFNLEVDEIEAFGMTEDFLLQMPAMPSIPEHAMRVPRAYRFDTEDKGSKEVEKMMRALEEKLAEMQRKLEKLESKMK